MSDPNTINRLLAGEDDPAPMNGHYVPEADEAEAERRIEYRRLSSRELATGDFTLEFLIDNTLVAGQPLLIGGGHKTLKTSIIIDAAVSLSTGGHFLGKLNCPRACRVAVMSGESGLATIQETARRICIAAGVHLESCDNLVWSPDLPKFGRLDHLGALREFLGADEIEVLFLDPAYLCMPSADAGNLMAQGELLRGMSELCQSMGVTLAVAHHTKKHTGRDKFDPPELEDLAWAGFAEFARQWWLIARRERFEPGTGDHKLWLNIGGSAGHSAMWALDVAEGTRSAFTERQWHVDMNPPGEARTDAHERREQAKAERKARRDAERAEADRKAVVDAMTKLARPETVRQIAAAARLPNERGTAAILDLIQSGDVIESPEPIAKGNGQTYPAYQLKHS